MVALFEAPIVFFLTILMERRKEKRKIVMTFNVFIDTIEEVNVNGFLMNNIKFMPTVPQCVEIYQLCWL